MTVLSQEPVQGLTRREQLLYLFNVLAKVLPYPSDIDTLARELGLRRGTLYSYARKGSIPEPVAKLIVKTFGEDLVTVEELLRS